MKVDIRIQPMKEHEQRLFPEYPNLDDGELIGIGIVDGGMVSGKPSVGFIVKPPHGEPCLVEMSAEMLMRISCTVKGAMARFGHPWEG